MQEQSGLHSFLNLIEHKAFPVFREAVGGLLAGRACRTQVRGAMRAPRQCIPFPLLFRLKLLINNYDYGNPVLFSFPPCVTLTMVIQPVLYHCTSPTQQKIGHRIPSQSCGRRSSQPTGRLPSYAFVTFGHYCSTQSRIYPDSHYVMYHYSSA